MTHHPQIQRRRAARARRLVAFGTCSLALLAALTTMTGSVGAAAHSGAGAMPSARAVSSTAVSSLAVSSTAVSSTGTAAGAIQWSVVPANADGPDGRISLRHVVEPGDHVDDAIAVTNLGSQPVEFSVAVGDGMVGASGAFDVSPEEPVGAGAWISVDGTEDGRLALGGGEMRVLPVTVAVPAHATPGDHPAGIVVGLSDVDAGVTVTHRIGVRLHLQVAGELDPALRISDVTTSYAPSLVPFAPGTLRVHYQVANTGNVRLAASTRLTVAGPFGSAPVHVSDAVEELLPGDAVMRSVEISTWPLVVLSGDVSVSARGIGEDQVPLPPPEVRAATVIAVPWTGIGLVVVLVIAVVLRRRRRRRRTKPAAAPETTPSPPSSEHETSPADAARSSTRPLPATCHPKPPWAPVGGAVPCEADTPPGGSPNTA